MSMIKIKSRRVKRARRRSKHTTRKGYRKYRKYYTRKHVKRTQCQGKGRMRRQTRSKRGGFSLFKSKPTKSTEFNFSLPSGEDVQIQGKGLAYVTKLGGFLSQSDRVEQIIIYQKKNEQGKASGNYFIARCVSSDCSEGKNMESKILETTQFEQVYRGDSGTGEYDFTTTTSDKYRIQPVISKFNPLNNDEKSLSGFLANNSVNLLAAAAAEARAAAAAAAAADTYPTAADATALATDPIALATDPIAVTTSADPAAGEVNLTNDNDLKGIKDMLKKAAGPGDTSQQCAFFCKPDYCDAGMLKKLKEKFDSVKEEQYPDDVGFVDLASILDDDSLLLILENLCVEYDKTATDPKKIDIFIESMKQCKTRLNMLFKQNDKLHDILRIFYNKCFRFISLDLDIKNMKKLLHLLNDMTPQNREKLLDLLNYMTPQNMKKLLDLLNSMTPESISKLLTGLAALNQDQIEGMLDTYNKLNKNPESMARLLELYSFIEKSQNGNEVLIHRYKGETPLSQRIYRTREHSPETCDSVTALHNQVTEIFKEGRLTIQEDKEFKKVLEECKKYHPLPEVVTGGRRKRRTLKKKRGGNSKR